MAAKKKAAKKAEQQPMPIRERISGPEYRGGCMYFSERDLSVYELARTRFDNATVMSEVILHRIEKERREANERIVSMRNDQFANAKDLEKLRLDVLVVEKEINEKYGVNLVNVTYDDKTGKIFENRSSITDGGVNHGTT